MPAPLTNVHPDPATKIRAPGPNGVPQPAQSFGKMMEALTPQRAAGFNELPLINQRGSRTGSSAAPGASSAATPPPFANFASGRPACQPTTTSRTESSSAEHPPGSVDDDGPALPFPIAPAKPPFAAADSRLADAGHGNATQVAAPAERPAQARTASIAQRAVASPITARPAVRSLGGKPAPNAGRTVPHPTTSGIPAKAPPTDGQAPKVSVSEQDGLLAVSAVLFAADVETRLADIRSAAERVTREFGLALGEVSVNGASIETHSRRKGTPHGGFNR
ncbi:MAG: hypothetical protein JWM33_2430 [Caulobacteraceae bacterium]|nr:hypothetical protein [Caulobacteraceae bacterium]